MPFEGTVLVEPSGELGGEAAGPHRGVAAAAEARKERGLVGAGRGEEGVHSVRGVHWLIAVSPQPYQFKVTMEALEGGQLRSLNTTQKN